MYLPDEQIYHILDELDEKIRELRQSAKLHSLDSTTLVSTFEACFADLMRKITCIYEENK